MSSAFVALNLHNKKQTQHENAFNFNFVLFIGSRLHKPPMLSNEVESLKLLP